MGEGCYGSDTTRWSNQALRTQECPRLLKSMLFCFDQQRSCPGSEKRSLSLERCLEYARSIYRALCSWRSCTIANNFSHHSIQCKVKTAEKTQTHIMILQKVAISLDVQNDYRLKCEQRADRKERNKDNNKRKKKQTRQEESVYNKQTCLSLVLVVIPAHRDTFCIEQASTKLT
jgi:hypothetical protein